MDKKQIEIAVAYPEKRPNGWYIKALLGPFETKEEADHFASRTDFIERPGDPLPSLADMPYVTAFVLPKSDDPPPPITPA